MAPGANSIGQLMHERLLQLHLHATSWAAPHVTTQNSRHWHQIRGAMRRVGAAWAAAKNPALRELLHPGQQGLAGTTNLLMRWWSATKAVAVHGGGWQRLLEVVTKSEVGQSADWLLNTPMEDLWDGDDDKIYTNFISRYYELCSVLFA